MGTAASFTIMRRDDVFVGGGGMVFEISESLTLVLLGHSVDILLYVQALLLMLGGLLFAGPSIMPLYRQYVDVAQGVFSD